MAGPSVRFGKLLDRLQVLDGLSLGDGTKKVLTSDVNFWKGVGEGVYGAGKGIVSAAKSSVDMMDGQALVNAGPRSPRRSATTRRAIR